MRAFPHRCRIRLYTALLAAVALLGGCRALPGAAPRQAGAVFLLAKAG